LYAPSSSPIIAKIAHDILAIPGVSISIKHLFSSMTHTMPAK
jgi:hypothetical protein